MLLFDVNGQTLKRTDHFNPATDSLEYLKAKFTFNDSAWSGKTKTALFRLGTAVYKSVLGTDGTCKVPSEVLVGGDSRVARIHGETIHVSLIGEYSTIRITTNEIAVKLNRSGYADAETPSDPTESEYQQMTAVAADAVAEAEEARAACENARADLVGVKNLFANAIKGNLSGAVVFADDVSPVEHNPIVKVHGKNRAKSFMNESDGTGYANCLYIDGDLKPNTTYTISFIGADGHTIYFNENMTTVYTWTKCTGVRQSVTITTKPDISSQYYDGKGYAIAKNNPGNTVAPSFSDVQIEEGDTATDYEAYIDPSTVTVKRCGKNLIPYPFYQSASEINGGKFTANSDGSVSVSGTATGVSYLTLYSGKPLVKHGKFTLSLSGVFTNIIYQLTLHDGDGNELLGLQDSVRQVIDADDYPTAANWTLNVKRHTNTTISGRVYPQIECGEKATEFEQYKTVTTHIPASDGTVSDITSIAPNMTILTDTDGVTVECEYIRDSNKVIEKLTNAITALGGTV